MNVCSHCKQQYSRSNILYRSLKTFDYICPNCWFREQKELEKQYFKMNNINCASGYTYEEIQKLREQGYCVNIFLTFKDKDFICPCCGKEYDDKKEFLKHEIPVKDKKRFLWCLACGADWIISPQMRFTAIKADIQGDIIDK